MQTDVDGKASASFYTTDSPHQYNVVWEGVTLDGRPCRYETMLDKYND